MDNSALPPIEIIYSQKKGSSASIKDGKIILRISSLASSVERQEHIHHLLQRMVPLFEHWEKKIDVLGDMLPGSILRFVGGTTMVVPELDNSRIQKMALAHAKTHVLPYAKEVLTQWKAYMGIEKSHQVIIKNVSSRWGSCSTSGQIMIALKTLLLPEELFEYVCVHELAHLVHMNHSKNFWEQVAVAMPHWKTLRKELHTYQ